MQAGKIKAGRLLIQPPRLETFSLDLTRVSAFPVLTYLTGRFAHSLRKLFSPRSSKPIFRRLAVFPFTSVRAGSQELIPELQNENAMHRRETFPVIELRENRKSKWAIARPAFVAPALQRRSNQARIRNKLRICVQVIAVARKQHQAGTLHADFDRVVGLGFVSLRAGIGNGVLVARLLGDARI